MKNNRVGFGIVGLGQISKTHARALQDQEDCYLVGGFHKNPEKAEKWAAENNCRAFTSLDEMLADPEIDAVSITTPSGSHMEPALAAMRAGKHVLIEKPMEITEDRIRMIMEEAEKHHVLICGIFQSRFHDAARLVKQAVDNGRFGTITLADAQFKWYRTQEYYDSGASCFFKVDWFTPDGMGAWGDGRTFVTGTDGCIEIRKYIDVGRSPDADHVYFTDAEGEHLIEAHGKYGFPYFGNIILDCINNTDFAIEPEKTLEAMRIAIEASNKALRREVL